MYCLTFDYVAEHGDNGDLQLWEFPTPDDVATFMWGRDFEEYRIYKRARRFEWTDGDLYKFKQALEAF